MGMSDRMDRDSPYRLPCPVLVGACKKKRRDGWQETSAGQVIKPGRGPLQNNSCSHKKSLCSTLNLERRTLIILCL